MPYTRLTVHTQGSFLLTYTSCMLSKFYAGDIPLIQLRQTCRTPGISVLSSNQRHMQEHVFRIERFICPVAPAKPHMEARTVSYNSHPTLASMI